MSKLSAEMIIVASEVLNGFVSEANAGFLGNYLTERGIPLTKVSIIPDEEEAILRAYREAMARSPLVFSTGGLGPTEDDLTKKVLEQLTGEKSVQNAEALKVAQENYARLKLPWHADRNHYHLVPASVRPLNNPQGLAPGLCFPNPGQKGLLLCAPGVPREFKAMAVEVFWPLIQDYFRDELGPPFGLFKVRTHGLPEEKIFFKLCPELWPKLSSWGKLSCLPRVGGVDLVVTYDTSKYTEAELKNRFMSLMEYEILAPHIWEWGGRSLEKCLFHALKGKGLTLALAESCTGGLLSSKLTDIPGVSECYMGGAVTYSNLSKENVLGVKAYTLEQHGAVSEAVAAEMARTAASKFNAHVGLSLTGIAGPSGGTPEKPVGTVCIGMYQEGQVATAQTYQFSGDRARLKERFAAQAAFDLLRALR